MIVSKRIEECRSSRSNSSASSSSSSRSSSWCEYVESEEEEDALTEEEMGRSRPRYLHLYEMLYGPDEAENTDNPGTEISTKTREREGLGTEFVYGEVTYRSMIRILSSTHVSIGASNAFVDFGSGSGKAVFSAALISQTSNSTPFSTCIGVEYMHDLHNYAERIRRERYSRFVRPVLEVALPRTRPRPSVVFERCDFMSKEWSKTLNDCVRNAALLFAHSTMFDSSMMVHLGRRTASMAPSTAAFVTLSLELPAETNWVVVDELFLDMSWGGSVVFIHKKGG